MLTLKCRMGTFPYAAALVPSKDISTKYIAIQN